MNKCIQQYRQMRRKEQDRVTRMETDYQKRLEIAEYHLRREERLKAAEERTAKKRQKRLKKKERKKEKKKTKLDTITEEEPKKEDVQVEHLNSEDPSDDSDD